MDEVSKEINVITQKSVADPSAHIFTLFFECLLNKTHEQEAGAIRAFVTEHSKQLKLDLLQKKGLSDWLTHHSNTLTLTYDLPTFRQLISFAYIAICEYRGPVKADQFLAQTIKEMKPMAEKMQINLHDFL
jgi:hypothetical protein